MEIMKRLFKEEEGQGMVEYVLIIGVISLAIVVLAPGVITAITGLWGRVTAAITGSGS